MIIGQGQTCQQKAPFNEKALGLGGGRTPRDPQLSQRWNIWASALEGTRTSLGHFRHLNFYLNFFIWKIYLNFSRQNSLEMTLKGEKMTSHFVTDWLGWVTCPISGAGGGALSKVLSMRMGRCAIRSKNGVWALTWHSSTVSTTSALSISKLLFDLRDHI